MAFFPCSELSELKIHNLCFGFLFKASIEKEDCTLLLFSKNGL